jgi:transposase InsO family protein
VIFDGLLGVVCPWFVIQATSINTQSLTLLINRQKTIPINKAHKKYSYKLQGLNISHANHVWSTDITYIKIAGGMVYMAAIIDWHSKASLSTLITNCESIVLDILCDNTAFECQSMIAAI